MYDERSSISSQELLDTALLKPSKTIQIKIQLKKAKELKAAIAKKVDKYKVDKAYLMKDAPEKVFFINALVLNPSSGLPAALGFVTTGDYLTPSSVCLNELGDEFPM